jgi:hypothetical protein
MDRSTDGGHAYSPKTVYEVHLVIRGTLAHAVRRGLLTRNVALVAGAPKLRSIPKVEQQAWTATDCRRSCRQRLVTACSPPCGCQP